MYSIFFHTTGLALIEILFYFYYIGPMESNIFKNTMKDIINENKKIKKYNISLITDYINNDNVSFIDNYEDIIKQKKDDRLEYNEKLFNDTMIYWIIMLGVSIFILILYKILKNKKCFKENYLMESSSDVSIEMIEDITSRNILSRVEENSENSEFLNDINKKKTCKKFVITKCLYYLFFISMILGFEYIFFNYVVLKYKVISKEEMEYLLYQELKE